jgi:hypothetical protein
MMTESSGSLKRTLLFVHIPKAAGSAFAGVIGNRFAAAECLSIYDDHDPADDELHAARFVFGHVTMSIAGRFEHRPFTITVLRDPIERALSTYSYFRALNPEEEQFAAQLDGELERRKQVVPLCKQHSIDEFIRVAPDLAERYLGSLQSRMLGGTRLDGTDQSLEAALGGLHRCDFVGLAERLDESAGWLARRLGWADLTPLPRTNISGTRLRRDQIPPRAMDGLLELTSVDRDLYEHTVRLYEGHLAEWGSDGDPRDPTAGIGDAPAVSDLRFGEPLRGSGWLGREQIEDQPHFCWIGHTATAKVDLADNRGARSVVVEIAHVLDPAILQTLRITVNGETVPHQLIASRGGVIASAPLGQALRRRVPRVSVKLAVDHTTRPCDVNPRTSDNRELGIGVQRVALVPDEVLAPFGAQPRKSSKL